MKRKRRRRDEWCRLVTEWRESGESAAAFAGRIGVAPHTVYRWRTAVEDAPQEARAAAVAKIVELRPALPLSDDRFELRLVGGRLVSIPTSFDEAALVRLVRVLEAAP